MGAAAPDGWGPLHAPAGGVQVVPNETAPLAVGAGLARRPGVDDYDPTDRVFVGYAAVPAEVDDSPTSPIVIVEDHTRRQRCEFEEDTVEEYFV